MLRPAVLAALLSVLAAFPCRADLELTTEEIPPFSTERGEQVDGIATRILREAMARAGFSYSIRLYPWMRAYDWALNKPDGCVFSTSRSAQREPLFKWVGPLVTFDWVIFVMEGSTAEIRTTEDLKRYRTVGTPGDAMTTILQGYGVPVELMPVPDPLPMLAGGRIDFWVTSRQRGHFLADQAGVAIKDVLPIGKADMYLACNLRQSDAVIDTLNRVLRQMKEDGTSAAIERAYR